MGNKIAIIGSQCAGKTTFANLLQQQCTNSIIVKFAEPLYAINSVLGINKNRKFMQNTSELIKTIFGPDFFIQKFHQQMNVIDRIYTYICDDCRYLTELEYLQKNHWLTVAIHASHRIRQMRANQLGLEFIEEHSSETDVLKIAEYCDIHIANNNNDNDFTNMINGIEIVKTLNQIHK